MYLFTEKKTKTKPSTLNTHIPNRMKWQEMPDIIGTFFTKKLCTVEELKHLFKSSLPQNQTVHFFFMTAVTGNHLRSFQLCYKDRCLNDPLLLDIICSASEIKKQLPPNSGCLFRNYIGIFFITKLPSLSWGLARTPLVSTDSVHHQ